MAKEIQIKKENNTLRFIVDDNEIQDVVAYSLCEEIDEAPTLTLKIAILKSIEVQR